MQNEQNHIQIGSVKIPTNEFAIAGSAWLGIKKAGKTYGAKGVAEQLMSQGIPLIVFDAIGMWRYLKTSGDHRGGRGFEIVVAGGEEPDIPLTASNASEIIRAAMRSNVSLVIDLYDPRLSKADWRKIVQTGFHTLLYENKKHGPRYVILEEAAEFVPQKVFDGETYAAVEKAVRMGGNAGLGVALVTPRSQEINKAVLDMCDNLVLMRQRGSAAIDALEKWMNKVQPDMAAAIAQSLPNMSSGECWVWAENSDTPVRTQTKRLQSFHPDRTKPSDVIQARKSVNTSEFVAKLLADLPKVVEEQKNTSVVELQKRIKELERQLQRPAAALPAPAPEIKEVSVLTELEREVIDNKLAGLTDVVKELMTAVQQDIASVRGLLDKAVSRITPVAQRPVVTVKPSDVKRFSRQVLTNTPTHPDVSPVGQKILDALVELGQLGVDAPVREMVALMAGYTNLASTGFVKAIGQLRTAEMVRYPDSETLAITDHGRNYAHVGEAPRSSEEIQDRVCSILGGKAAEILRPLIAAYPNAMDRMDVAAAAGYTNLASTGFVKVVGKLRSLGFVDYPDTKTMRATAVLFLNGQK